MAGCGTSPVSSPPLSAGDRESLSHNVSTHQTCFPPGTSRTPKSCANASIKKSPRPRSSSGAAALRRGRLCASPSVTAIHNASGLCAMSTVRVVPACWIALVTSSLTRSSAVSMMLPGRRPASEPRTKARAAAASRGRPSSGSQTPRVPTVRAGAIGLRPLGVGPAPGHRACRWLSTHGGYTRARGTRTIPTAQGVSAVAAPTPGAPSQVLPTVPRPVLPAGHERMGHGHGAAENQAGTRRSTRVKVMASPAPIWTRYRDLDPCVGIRADESMLAPAPKPGARPDRQVLPQALGTS